MKYLQRLSLKLILIDGNKAQLSKSNQRMFLHFTEHFTELYFLKHYVAVLQNSSLRPSFPFSFWNIKDCCQGLIFLFSFFILAFLVPATGHS